MSRTICFVVFVCVIAGGLANPATNDACEESTKCEVTSVDIAPCANPSLCILKIGKNATINFDFVPEFAASELETDVSYKGISFAGLDKNGCRSTSCPVSSGVKQTFSYVLQLRRRTTAKGTYTIKWKVWNKADTNQLCCFMTNIKLT